MLNRKILKIVCILFLLSIISSISFAETIVNTGAADPNENGGMTLSTTVYRAGEFSLQKNAIITNIHGWMGNNLGTGYGPGNITIALYDDGGDAPGNELYSEVLYIPPTDQEAWHGLSDLHWPLRPGEYWVSFEVRASDGQTFHGYLPRLRIPNPLTNYAAYDNFILSPTRGEWVSDSTRFAVRIEGRYTVHNPAFDCGTIVLTNNAIDDKYPQINNHGQVAWLGHDGNDYEVFFYNGSSILELTDNTYDDIGPGSSIGLKINNFGQIAWNAYDGNDYEVFFYDGSSILQLTDNTYDDTSINLNDSGHVVWNGYDGTDREIFHYNGVNTNQLTDNTSDDDLPDINNAGSIVWTGFNNENRQIFLYENTITTQLTNNAFNNIFPKINDNRQIVWRADNTENSEIFLYDGSQISQLTDNLNNDGTSIDPKLNNNGHVIWITSFGYRVGLYLFNGTEIQELTNDSWDYYAAQINNKGQVVWRVMGRDIDYEVFFSDGISSKALTDNSETDIGPQINDNGLVVWSGSDGNDFEIYISKPGEDTDGDMVLCAFDAFPEDSAASLDSDEDGHPDAWNPEKTQQDSTTGLTIDNCPSDPNKFESGVCGCGVADTDSDGNGKPDCNDNTFPWILFLPAITNKH